MNQKYFIAILPPESVLAEIESIKRDISEKYNNKSALRAPAHITLHMPFEMKASKEEVLIQTISEFNFSIPFKVQLKNFSCFEPKVIFVDVVPNDILSALQKEFVYHIKSKLQIFNQYEDTRGYHPHITIAFRDLKKSDFYLAYEEYKSKSYKAEFNVNSFFLLKHTGKNWVPHKEFLFTT